MTDTNEPMLFIKSEHVGFRNRFFGASLLYLGGIILGIDAGDLINLAGFEGAVSNPHMIGLVIILWLLYLNIRFIQAVTFTDEAKRDFANFLNDDNEMHAKIMKHVTKFIEDNRRGEEMVVRDIGPQSKTWRLQGDFISFRTTIVYDDIMDVEYLNPETCVVVNRQFYHILDGIPYTLTLYDGMRAKYRWAINRPVFFEIYLPLILGVLSLVIASIRFLLSGLCWNPGWYS